MKIVACLAYIWIALITLCSQAAATEHARMLRYVGTREIFTGLDSRAPQSVKTDNHFSVVDDVTWIPVGPYVDRVDNIDLTLVGPDSTELNPVFGSLIPKVEKRTERERRVRIGLHDIIQITQRSITTDQPPAAENPREMGISQDYLLTTVYARPSVALALSGTPFTYHNSPQRLVFHGAAGEHLATSVSRDGAIAENLFGNSHFTQAPDGSAHFNTGMAGFFSEDLVVDAPTEAGGVKTIHSVRTSSGRTVGAYPVNKTDVTVPDWYPGGLPGSSDTLRVVGKQTMPEMCERPLGMSVGFESIETRSETRATGEVTTETIQSYTHGSTILCTSDEHIIRIFDTATGTLAQTSRDMEVLHLTSTPPTVSVSLVADHEPSFGFGADRHAVGPHVLTIGVGETKTVALRLTPASIDGDPSAKLTVEPALAQASLGDQNSIAVVAGSTPGKAVLTVRSPKAGGALAKIPIFIFRRLDLGCDDGEMDAVAFNKDGSISEVKDPERADVRIDCSKGRNQATLFLPFGATAFHTDVFDTDTYASVRPSEWSASAFSFDTSSAIANFLRTPGNDHDEAQDILLLKTRAGLIVKILCARRAEFSLHGIYAVTNGDEFR